jgi:hypothetical protein
MFEFLDLTLSKVRRRQARGKAANDDVLKAAGTGEWLKRKMLVRFLTRITYIAITTLLGALLPFFEDFLELGGALIIFPLNFGLVHNMYMKVRCTSYQTSTTTSPHSSFNLPHFKYHYQNFGIKVVNMCFRVFLLGGKKKKKTKNIFCMIQNIKYVGRIQMFSRYMKNQGRM